MKINLKFGGGKSDCVYDINQRKMYCYETDYNLLHKNFGGNLFYQSRTGLTGKGYLVKTDTLVKFGFYRIDIHSFQQEKQLIANQDERKLWGYCPICGHQGIAIPGSNPIVLTDGTMIIYIGHEAAIPNIITRWYNNELIEYTDKKEYQLHFLHYNIDQYNNVGILPVEFNYKVYYSYKIKYFDYIYRSSMFHARFLNLREHFFDFKDEIFRVDIKDMNYILAEKLRLIYIENKNAFYKRHFQLPLLLSQISITDTVINGWNNLSENNFFCFKKRVDVYTLAAFAVATIDNVVYEYETNFSIYDNLPDKEIIEHMERSIVAKYKEDQKTYQQKLKENKEFEAK